MRETFAFQSKNKKMNSKLKSLRCANEQRPLGGGMSEFIRGAIEFRLQNKRLVKGWLDGQKPAQKGETF